MEKRSFIIMGVALVLLAIAGGSVEAKDKPFHASFVGTATNKDDFSFTGTPALYLPVAGKSTLGPYTANPVKVGICRDFRGFAVREACREDGTTAVASPRSEHDDIRRRL